MSQTWTSKVTLVIPGISLLTFIEVTLASLFFTFSAICKKLDISDGGVDADAEIILELGCSCLNFSMTSCDGVAPTSSKYSTIGGFCDFGFSFFSGWSS